MSLRDLGEEEWIKSHHSNHKSCFINDCQLISKTMLERFIGRYISKHSAANDCQYKHLNKPIFVPISNYSNKESNSSDK